jgi:hypothetical protein
MIECSLDAISPKDVEFLVKNEVPEGRTLDYKEQLDIGTGDEKKEFLRDITSFANAQGGDLIFGIKERRENGKPTGIPESICGVQTSNFDSLKLQLEHIIRTGVDPKLPSLRMREIACPDGTVFIIRVGRSWTKPHRVMHGSSQFYVRGNAGKQPLDSLELRDAFLQSFELEEAIRKFRDERLATILSNELLLPLNCKSILVMHFIPLSTFRTNNSVDLSACFRGERAVPTSHTIRGYIRPNIDGLIHVSTGTPDVREAYGYTQLFHSGAVEIIDGYSITEVGDIPNTISSHYVEEAIVKGVDETFKYLMETKVEGDVIALVSMLGLKGLQLHQGRTLSHRSIPYAVDRNHLLFKAMRMELDMGYAQYSKSICDQFWQAFGAQGSPNFDADGRRVRG